MFTHRKYEDVDVIEITAVDDIVVITVTKTDGTVPGLVFDAPGVKLQKEYFE